LCAETVELLQKISSDLRATIIALADIRASLTTNRPTRTLMTKTTSTIVLITGLMLASASEITAQTTTQTTSQTTSHTILDGKAFVNVNVGGQTATDVINGGASFPIYDQTATWSVTENVDHGAIFDISGGYHAWRDLSVAIGFSSFRSTGTASGVALIPSPVFFNRPNMVALDVTTAPRRDRNVYVVAMWFLPIQEKVDVAFSIGPSFTRVRQQVVTEVNVPSNTSDAVANVETQSGTAKGLFVGIDGTYMFLKWIGAGAFIRYNGGSLNLPSAPDLSVGGFQAGIGARLRF
jgi:hypothetical protein